MPEQSGTHVTVYKDVNWYKRTSSTEMFLTRIRIFFHVSNVDKDQSPIYVKTFISMYINQDDRITMTKTVVDRLQS